LNSSKFVETLLVKRSVVSRQRCSQLQAVCLITTFLFCLLSPNAFARKAPEYQLKANFLVHFLDFVKWPNSNSDDKTICILGRNPFNNYLQELASFASNKQKFVMKYAATLNDTQDCHILFISRSETKHLNQILAKLASRPLLTVSDIVRFAANSGMIELASKSSKTKLIINLNAVRSVDIKLNSNLIDLAQVVGGQQKGKTDK